MPIRCSVKVIPAFVLTVGLAVATSAQSPSGRIKYSAAATNLDPSVNIKATLVDMTVDRWSTDEERQKLMDLLVESGQGKLLRALQDLPRVGTIKTPDSLSYDLRYARRFATEEGGERVVLVTDRYIGFWEAASQSRTLEYPFMIIELRLEANGRGEGKMSVATKLTADDKTGQIVLENWASQPVRLTNVKREIDSVVLTSRRD